MDSDRHYLLASPLPFWALPPALVLTGLSFGVVTMSSLLVAYGHRELNLTFAAHIAGSGAYLLLAAVAGYLTRLMRVPPPSPSSSPSPPPPPSPSSFPPPTLHRFQYRVIADGVDWLLLPSLVCQGWSASMAAAHFAGPEWRSRGIVIVYVAQVLALVGSAWHLRCLRWERLRHEQKMIV
ncbi:hypothetical protein CC85DRAFT_304053 [Cutaneotrichosporon oleaginosum]|uniref:Uncharacterized protein n=1 Tax=Cutaneotrichosporon oleaginosum TaxID=879819 RepID=A0A0J0XHF5_9TREE|nr:uncharacterized protein CC85DRAFT_304053 [Cutaneotrichosporon oleaginosum]KLT40526.1 hypothetical protein CC85DRAFT_304053 [Cutaneotrichosporon oleaginosum]TXT08403.1 hypothetical protein COLE_05327 [Cutaneotrichosporon oleaginosum]